MDKNNSQNDHFDTQRPGSRPAAAPNTPISPTPHAPASTNMTNRRTNAEQAADTIENPQSRSIAGT